MADQSEFSSLFTGGGGFFNSIATGFVGSSFDAWAMPAVYTMMKAARSLYPGPDALWETYLNTNSTIDNFKEAFAQHNINIDRDWGGSGGR